MVTAQIEHVHIVTQPHQNAPTYKSSGISQALALIVRLKNRTSNDLDRTLIHSKLTMGHGKVQTDDGLRARAHVRVQDRT